MEATTMTNPLPDTPRHPDEAPTRVAPPEIQPLVPPGLTTERAPQTLADKVHGSVEHDVCGNLPDLAPAELRAVPERHQFDAANYFLHVLSRACQSVRNGGESLELRGMRWPIRIQGSTPMLVHVGCKDTVLRPFCVIRTEPGAIIPVPASAAPEDGARLMRAEDVLWNVALWTSRGRLPSGTDPLKPVRLRAWPNFTRVAAVPNAMRITALWTSAMFSPIEIAQRLKLPQRVVFTFYSAAVSAGLMVTQGESRAEPAAPRATEPKRRSLFARILRTLTHAR